MMICPVCGRECKSLAGLRAHMRSHPADAKPKEEVIEKVEVVEEVQPISLDECLCPVYRIKLYNNLDVCILEYRVMGELELQKAKDNAEKRGFKIVINK